MRRVPNERRAASGSAGLLPDGARLERSRWLARRFPEAHLRELTLVRAPIAGAGRTWLALESMQTTGSFKVRGALLAVEELVARSGGGRGAGAPVEIVAASAGNHGIGVACAAKVLGARATIVVPRGAPRTKTD